MLSYQPNSESCLIGCYNTEETKNFHRQRVFVLMVLCTWANGISDPGQRALVERAHDYGSRGVLKTLCP